MTTCRWVDVVSSDSCASFGRSALLRFERASRRAARNGEDNFGSDVDDCSDVIKDDVTDNGLGVDDSFMVRAGHRMTNDARTGVTMDMDRKMKISCHLDEALLDPELTTTDDSTLSPVNINGANQANVSGVNSQVTTMVSFSGFLKMESSSGSSLTPPHGTSPNKQAAQNDATKDASAATRGKSVETVYQPSMEDISVRQPGKHSGGKSAVNSANSNTTHSGKSKKVDTKAVSGKTNNLEASPSVDTTKGHENAKRVIGNSEVGSGIYFDEQTQKPLNPPKKANIQRDKVDQTQISQLLLNQFNQPDARPRAKDSQHSRICSRLKDIAIGKSTKGYQNYIRKVPIDQRTSDDPHTPNLRENVSAARFQVIYRKWRTDLHKYDNI